MNLSGILLVHKPQGLTSNATLQRVKRLLGVKKAGHTGSLDPLATGMLPICLGEATKVSQYLLDADKCYEVIGQLGVCTSTGDALGEVVEQRAGDCTETALKQAIDAHFGTIQQVPPMYSALKHQGIPLYKLARQGKTIERAAREIKIYQIVLQNFQFPYFSLRVVCSKGTYIRSLIESIGEKLNLGAHVTVLHRLYTAGFEQEPMYTLEELEAMSANVRLQKILPISRGVNQFPILQLSETETIAIRYGQVVHSSMLLKEPSLVQLYDHHMAFIGLGSLQTDGQLQPKRLLASRE